MEMTKAIEINSQRTNQKANFITVSWVLFLVGMTLSAIFIMFQIYNCYLDDWGEDGRLSGEVKHFWCDKCGRVFVADAELQIT